VLQLLSAWILLKRRGPAIRWRPLLSSPNSFWYRAGIMNPVHMLRVRKSDYAFEGLDEGQFVTKAGKIW
jgi:hypothetical protein